MKLLKISKLGLLRKICSSMNCHAVSCTFHSHVEFSNWFNDRKATFDSVGYRQMSTVRTCMSNSRVDWKCLEILFNSLIM